MALFFNQGQNPIANMLGDGQDQGPYNNSSNLLTLGLGLLSGKTPQEQAGNAASNYFNGRQSGRMTNQTVRFLQTANPELAQAVQSGALSAADAYKLHFAAQAKAEKPLSFQTLPDGTYGTFDASSGSFNRLGSAPKPPGADGGGNYGLNPIWTTDAAGKYHLVQPGKDGTTNEMKLGDGLTPLPGMNTVDTGTGFVPVDRRTGLPGAPAIQKDVAGTANQRTMGEGQGAAAVALPQAIQLAGQIDQQIKTLKADPDLPNVIGPVNGRTPNIFPSSVAVQAKIDQLKGGTFLQARQMLKGGGAITDYEGARADAAIARMNQAQSVDDFNAALDDYNVAVQQGVQKLQAAANGNFGVQPQQQGGIAPPAPAGGAPVMRKFNPVTGKIE